MSDASSVGDESGAHELPAPLGFTGVARHTLRLYKSHFLSLLRLYLVVQVGLFLIALALEVVYSYRSISVQLQSLLVMLQVTANAVAGSFAAAITAAFLVDRLIGREVTIGETWASLRPYRRDLLTASLLGAVLALAIFLFLFQLGVLLMPVFFGPPIVAHVVAVERMKLADGWPRARELGQREWGRIVMYLITLALAVAVIINVILFGIGTGLKDVSLEGDAIRTVAGVAFGLALPHLLFALSWPLISIGQAIVYLDIRARKEELTYPKLVQERAKLDPPSSESDPTQD